MCVRVRVCVHFFYFFLFFLGFIGYSLIGYDVALTSDSCYLTKKRCVYSYFLTLVLRVRISRLPFFFSSFFSFFCLFCRFNVFIVDPAGM